MAWHTTNGHTSLPNRCGAWSRRMKHGCPKLAAFSGHAPEARILPGAQWDLGIFRAVADDGHHGGNKLGVTGMTYR